MDDRQICPRRAENPGPWQNLPDTDTWETGHGLVGQDEVGPSCSYCGSLHPDRFMELVRDGWVVGPTDKSYKAYLTSPLTDEQKAAKRDRWMATDGIARALRDLGERDGKTAEQIQADLDDQWTKDGAAWMHGDQTAKFYFQHLSAEQRAEFIELHNSGRMQIGYPGHFYAPPFFTRTASAESRH